MQLMISIEGSLKRFIPSTLMVIPYLSHQQANPTAPLCGLQMHPDSTFPVASEGDLF